MGLIKTRFSAAAMRGRIDQHGARSSRVLLALMRDEGQKIEQLAKSFAPVDDGDLEQAIEMIETRDGLNGRTSVSVRVNPFMTDETGKPVLEYAMQLHEGQSIGENDGSYAFGLGQGSSQKDGGRGVVGGKFLHRAFLARIGMLGKRAKAALKGLI